MEQAYASSVNCPCCTPPSEYRRFFNRRMAAHEARRYRRRGLPKTARRLAGLAGDRTGASVLDAFDRLEVLESTAEAVINSRPLGEVVPMSDAVINELQAAFFKKL